MGELEERISGVLNDPKQLQEIMDMARSLMDGGGAEELLRGFGAAAAPEPPGQALFGAPAGASSGGRDTRALLEAMRPWLSEKRRGKLERALRLSRLAHLALTMLGKEGEGHV